MTKVQQLSIRELVEQSRTRKSKKIMEKGVPILLFIAAFISVITTLGILFTLLFETFEFFQRIPVVDFLFGTT
ncbi:MAG: phosphate ABC transporter permease subunit PstC, partial [Lysinibacillus sp.]